MNGISMFTLYNMMNDNRHLVIGDLRQKEQFNEMQIRGSCCIQDDDVNNTLKFIQIQDTNGTKNEAKYKTQPIRRLVLVNEDVVQIEEKKEVLIELIQSLNMKQYKIAYLKAPVTQFLQMYPFFKLSKQIIENYDNKEQNFDQQAMLFSYSQFPSALLDDGSLYLGSNTNSNSKKQLESLHIKTIIDLKVYEGEDVKISDWKKEQFNYINYPISQQGEQVIDFQDLTSIICLAAKPVLICCPDGNSVTNVVAIGYLMTMKKQNYNTASLRVFQIRGNTTVDKLLYSQILTYKVQ